MQKYDLIVVGAGTAGCLATKVAVENGLDVCLIEKKPMREVGFKVCGDAVGKHHFDNLKLPYPSGSELAGTTLGIDVCSPDLETTFRVRGEGLYGFMINRHEFGQRLLHEALDQGVTLLDNSMALEPIIEKNFVKGVMVKDLKKNQKLTIYAQLTIDASGFAASLRKKLPLEWNFETVDQEDVILCYREIREIKADIDSNYCQIYLNQEVSPGGYTWIFPKGPSRVNVGLGVQMKGNYPSPKNLLYNHILSQPLFKNSKILTGGGGMVPTRRPLNCLVANGILLTGDAACLVNPIHGGGIGPSMMSGKLAAETAARAIDNRDVSREGLWQYNINYMKSYGAKQAGLDVFRLFLQSCTDEELNYGMKHRLVREEDILAASVEGELKLHLTEKALRVLRGVGKLGLLNRLRLTARWMREIKALYQRYPAPAEFNTWKGQVKQIYMNARRRLVQSL